MHDDNLFSVIDLNYVIKECKENYIKTNGNCKQCFFFVDELEKCYFSGMPKDWMEPSEELFIGAIY